MIELFPPELTKHRAIANANSSDISVFMAELERLEVAGFSRIVSSNSNDIIDFEDLGITHKTNISDYFILVDR